MGYALYIAIGFIIFLALGSIKQHRDNNYLRKLLKSYNGKSLLFSLNETGDMFNEKYECILTSEQDLTNPKSDLRRLMKKTGIQELPCAFNLNEKEEIIGEKITKANKG